MLPTLEPLPLPATAQEALLNLASEADVLALGECHGTQEMPRLIVTLLPALSARGYSGLGLEMDPDDSAALRAWAAGETETLPRFFAQPSGDGRGSLQVLAMVRRLFEAGWTVFTFDGTSEHWTGTWASRDRGMAESYAVQFLALPAGSRAVALCGNAHARLAPIPKAPDLWPSCAENLRTLLPGHRIRALDVDMHEGTFYNANRVRRIRPDSAWPWGEDTGHVAPCDDGAYSLRLHLRTSTAATFVGFSGARLSTGFAVARLAGEDPSAGPRRYGFVGHWISAEMGPPPTFMYLTPKGNIICHETTDGGHPRNEVLRVFPSVAEAAASGRYGAGLIEEANRAMEEIRDQEVEAGPGVDALRRMPNLEVLDA